MREKKGLALVKIFYSPVHAFFTAALTPIFTAARARTGSADPALASNRKKQMRK